MPTNIRTYDGNLIAVANDGNLNTWSSTLKFPGRGYTGYGEAVMEDLVWTATHFSGNVAPTLPLTGQLWYDSDNSQIKLYDPLAYSIGWKAISPIGSLINADPTDVIPPTNSDVDVIRVTDETGLLHNAIRVTVNGELTGVFSSDTVYQANVTTGPLAVPGFTTIYPGLNINPTISNSAISASKLVVQGTALSSALVGGAIEYDNHNFFLTFPDNHGNLNRNTPVFQSQLVSSNRIYVSLNGADVNGDGTVNNGFNSSLPMRSIRAALASPAAMAGGYTIVVESGTYYESNPLYIPPKTSIVGDNLRQVTVIPIYPMRDVIHANSGTYIYGITIRNHRRPSFAVGFPAGMANVTVNNSGHISVRYLHSYGYPIGTIPNVFVEPTLTSQSNVTIAPNMAAAAITEIVVTFPGSGYSKPPPVNIIGSSGSAVAVSRINARGQVIAVEMVDPGTGYLTTPTYPTIVIAPPPGFPGPGLQQATAMIPKAPSVVGNVLTADLTYSVTYYVAGQATNAILLPENGIKDNAIRSFTVPGSGPTYTHVPHISIDSPFKTFGNLTITSSPYVQNSSSITGPFDVNGVLIPLPGQPVSGSVPNAAQYSNTVGPTLPFNINLVPGFANVDISGAGGGIRVDGQVLSNSSVTHSFVADSFTQINQGGIGHLLINKGYAQFVSCFTTFSSVGYWARCGGFANISNSVIDFGNIGLRADGYYPIAYAAGTALSAITSNVTAATVTYGGIGYTNNFTVNFINAANTSPASGTAIVQGGSVIAVEIDASGSNYLSVPTVDFSTGSGTGALAIAYLLPNLPTVSINSNVKPRFNSVVLFGATPGIYTITNVSGSGSTWSISPNPSVYTVVVSDTTQFFEPSNLSSGSLSLEYVGSGTTYNALPAYGGVPVTNNQVRDGVNPIDQNNAGRVYYVTIDNTGNFKVGNYFSVNFADGKIQMNPGSNPGSTIVLTGLTSIGPFVRNSVPVGTYANEISDDARMTHQINSAYDHTTIPTQYAVNAYVHNTIVDTLGNVAVSIVPLTDNTVNVGTPANRWGTIWTGNSIVGNNNGSGTLSVNGSGGIVLNAGNIYAASGSLQIGAGSLNSSFKVDIIDTSPMMQLRHSSTIRGGMGANAPVIGAFYVGSYDASDLTIGTNNSEVMRLQQTTGFIGIGTRSPQSLLEVNSAIASSNIRITASPAYNSTIQLFDNSQRGWTIGRDGNEATNNFFINWSNVSTTYSNAISITPSGNVGIGGTATVPLRVVANARGYSSTVVFESFDNLGSGPKLTFTAQNGTPLSPTPPQLGDYIGLVGTIPLADASHYAGRHNSYMLSQATENYGLANLGSQLIFGVTKRGSNAVTQTMTISSDGTVSPARSYVTIGNSVDNAQPVLHLNGSNVSVALYGQQTTAHGDPGSLYFGNLAANHNWLHMTATGDIIPDLAGNTSNLGAVGSQWNNLYAQQVHTSGINFPDGTTITSGMNQASITPIGYQVLPSGLVMQWGTVSIGIGTSSFSLPYAPWNGFSITATPLGVPGSNNSWAAYFPDQYNGAIVWTSTISTTETFSWIAFGTTA